MEIAVLKSKLNIIEVAQHLGILLNRQSKALCPFHEDKNPSLQFSKEKQICTCFSSRCDAGTMDVIALTEKKLNISTYEAIQYLSQLAGEIPQIKISTPIRNMSEDLSKIAVLTKIFTYFKNAVSNSQPAKDYISKTRSLLINKLEVGYNSGQFHHRENKHLIESAVKYGLLKPLEHKGGHPQTPAYNVWGKNCIIFPLKNKQGQVVSLYGRSIYDNKDQRHFYLTGREGLYPGYPKATTRTLILTESIIDAASIEIKDMEILALYGTNGLTQEHTEALQSLKELKEIIFILNGDEPGKSATDKHSKALHELLSHIKITKVELPEGEDVNSLKQSHEPGIINHLLENRQLLFSVEKGNTLAIPEPSNKLNTKNPYKIEYHSETANYYIMGGIKKDLDSLKVTLVIEHPVNGRKSRNKPDLYEDKQVEKISREASEKLDLRSDHVESDLNILTDLLEEYRDNELTSLHTPAAKEQYRIENEKQCLDFLSKPNLINKLNELIGKAGVVGEENNRIFLLGIAASYKTSTPLHALVQGSSGSGKTHLMIKISELLPPEDVITLTRVTESSFYNYGETELKNKLICLEDLDGLKEEALMAFRELQSRGQLTSSTSGKDDNGNIKSFIRTVKGPIASMSCTTKGEVYEDNMSRSFLVAVDETKEQTKKIIQYQNLKASGQIDTDKEKQVMGFIRNCMRLIKPYEVINPYAHRIQLPEEAHKIRRLNDLYQSYVKQITLLNQYHREKDEKGRLIAEKEDLSIAGEIMFDSIMLKIDELDGALRLFYEKLKEYVKAKGGSTYLQYSFGRKEIRDVLRISRTQQHRFFGDLLHMEYIVYMGGSQHNGHRYRILEWDDVKKQRARIKQYLQGQLNQLEVFQPVPTFLEHSTKK